MDEHAVRTLLRTLADTPEPPSAVDVAAARRRGRRRLRIRRVAVPLSAAVAVVTVLTVPRALDSGHSERTVASPRHTASSTAFTAPEQFSPLVPYASFGWLPAGFSEGAANRIGWNYGFTSAADFVSLEAADPAAGHLLYLQVNARGACPVTASGALAEIHARGSAPVNCTDDGFTAMNAAPDVNGRPAFWLDYGSGIAWEYAPGAWATLQASITPAADEPHSRRWAAENGWVLHVRPGVRPASINSQAAVQAGIRDGKVLLPSAATRALLEKTASHVRYGQTTPLVFPFRLTGQLPAGWRLWQTSFAVSPSGRVVGTGITAGPGADTTALGVGASTAPGPAGCSFVAGQSSYLYRLGVQWIYRVLGEPDKQWQQLCATGPVDGLKEVYVSMDMNVPGSNTPLPGSAELGGALGVLTRLRFLGPSPAAWTTNPLA